MRHYAYCATVSEDGRVRVAEYVADDEDDLIGLHGDAVALERAPVDDAALVDWIRWEAEGWETVSPADLQIEIVRRQDPDGDASP